MYSTLGIQIQGFKSEPRKFNPGSNLTLHLTVWTILKVTYKNDFVQAKVVLNGATDFISLTV